MADTLPINFPIPTENVIASYNFFDFASGVGYRKLYLWGGINEEAGGGADTRVYQLTPQIIPSDLGNHYLERTTNGTSTINFDITFSTPTVISGRAIFSGLHTTSSSRIIDVSIELFKVLLSASTVSLGSVGTITTTSSVALRTAYLDVPETHFKIGETLRLALSVKHGGAGGDNVRFYFDPSGRVTQTETTTGATLSSEASILIPFKIQQ